MRKKNTPLSCCKPASHLLLSPEPWGCYTPLNHFIAMMLLLFQISVTKAIHFNWIPVITIEVNIFISYIIKNTWLLMAKWLEVKLLPFIFMKLFNLCHYLAEAFYPKWLPRIQWKHIVKMKLNWMGFAQRPSSGFLSVLGFERVAFCSVALPIYFKKIDVKISFSYF